jgi:hypothetical protein
VCFPELLWFREKEGELAMAQVMTVLAQERVRAPLLAPMEKQVRG